MKFEQKEADKAVMPKTKRRANFAAVAAGTMALLFASPEHIINNAAPIPSAFTI